MGTWCFTHNSRSACNVVGAMHDQVDGIRSYLCRWVLLAETVELTVHLLQPAFEAFTGALVQGRKTANHAFLAAGQGQLGAGDQKHGRRHQGQGELIGKGCR